MTQRMKSGCGFPHARLAGKLHHRRLASTNAGGTQVLKFGTMRSLVAGVEAVLPDGSMHRGSSGLKKDNRGYSLDQLLIGAEGTLGVITAVALRLVPRLRRAPSPGPASPARERARAAALPRARTESVEGFELVPQDSLELVLKHVPGSRAAASRARIRWHVLVEATTAEPQVDIGASSSGCSPPRCEAGHHRRCRDRRERSPGRGHLEAPRQISEAERAEGQTLAHDISVAVADMPEFIVEAAEGRSASSRASSPAASATSATATSISTSAPEARRAGLVDLEGEKITRLVNDLVTAAGGSISAEHGIGQLKRAEFARLASPGAHACAARDQGRARSAGHHEPGEAGSISERAQIVRAVAIAANSPCGSIATAPADTPATGRRAVSPLHRLARRIPKSG